MTFQKSIGRPHSFLEEDNSFAWLGVFSTNRHMTREYRALQSQFDFTACFCVSCVALQLSVLCRSVTTFDCWLENHHQDGQQNLLLDLTGQHFTHKLANKPTITFLSQFCDSSIALIPGCLYDTSWYCVRWHGTGWHDMVWHYMSWFNMTCHGMTCHVLVRHVMVWHDMSCNVIMNSLWGFCYGIFTF